MQVAKRNELHKLVVIPQRLVVERSFGWLDKCCRLWKDCERKLNTSLQLVYKVFNEALEQSFYIFKTITSDNGAEFAEHKKISNITGAEFYFANPYSSWERGLSKHTNALIRRFFPKGSYFNNISEQEIAKVERILNTRGRASLGFKKI